MIESAVQIDLHRTKTVSSGKTYFNYYVPVTAFGHEMKIEIRPKANSDGKVDPVSYERLALIFDVTREEKARSEAQERARNTAETVNAVVEKHMRTVQEIASLLGESAAETKLALNKLKEALPGEDNDR